MNTFDDYQAEIAYRREQMLRGKVTSGGTLRQWLRTRRTAS